MTHDALTALRISATLAHSMPLLRVRVRNQDRLLVDVAPGEAPKGADAVVATTPCGFRSSVASAWVTTKAGQSVALLDLPSGCEPSVEIGLPPNGRTYPGDIHRVALNGLHLYAFGSTVAVDTARSAMHSVAEARDPVEGMTRFGLRYDEATEVCVVYAEVDPGLVETEGWVIDVLQAVIAKIAVEQLVSELGDQSIRP